MEKLQIQSTCFDNIKSLCTNYKKDSGSRKNEDYLKKKLTSLEEQWKDFELRHQELLKEIQEKQINYFAENVYENIQQLYLTTKEDIETRLKTIQDQKLSSISFDLSNIHEDEPDDSLKHLLNKQKINFKAMERAISKCERSIYDEKWELEDNLSVLKTKWEIIDKLHWEIEARQTETDGSYYSAFVDIEAMYDEARRKLNNKINSNKHYEKSTPRIEIPTFSGDFKQWVSFKDLFLETIHNNPNLSNAQKMQHLKTKLRGEAERIVQHLSISASNYDSCWKLLANRYDNRHLQFANYMNTMLNLPSINQPDGFNLKRMHDTIYECMHGIANIGLDTATWDPIIVHLMATKLDSSCYDEYLRSLDDKKEMPNLYDFMDFLENRFLAYETKRTNRKESSNYQKPQTSRTSFPVKKPTYETKPSTSRIYHATYGQCPLCNKNHILMQCPTFIDMDTYARNSAVAKLNVCKNCLYSHGGEQCKSNKTCKECNLKHHTLLHNTFRKNTNIARVHSTQPTSTSAQQSINHLSNNMTEVLLATLQLDVQAIDGTYVTLRAILDQGSQINIVSEFAAQQLRLPRTRMNGCVSGVGTTQGECKGRIQLTCKAIHADYSFQTDALIMKKVTNNLPCTSFEKANWSHLNNLKLADPEYNVSRPIDLLLGADVYADIILDGVLKGKQDAPIAQQTQLGWVLCGKLSSFNCHVTLIDMAELTKFWETEEITQQPTETSTDQECEEYYRKTVQRNSEGQYVVRMPLVTDYEHKLGNSKRIAISQFLQLEKRLERNHKLAQMYRDFLAEYEDLGHMKIASTKTYNHSTISCYLPHHGILKESSTTTKLRTVFNASQKTTTGFSLNNLLEKGPNLQKDIQNLIINWRSYRYAFTADIEKMYRAIWLAEDQQPLQKIVWRSSPSHNLKEYLLCTLTYGTKSAPWLAMRTLHQLASDDGYKYPAAAKILKTEFFMDDLISGSNSYEEAKSLQKSLIILLKGGGMNLRKWASNDIRLLEGLSEELISSTNNVNFKNEQNTKTLGISWNPSSDSFNFNWPLQEELKTPTKLTKRSLLSQISKLYDPLGWLSPVTVSAKLIFQEVWVTDLRWDDELPQKIQDEWKKLKNELHFIKNVELPRWIGPTQGTIELFGFCDASIKAYACVVYSRTMKDDHTPVITLMAAKTKVAPISQKITLPRMELCGALLLAELTSKIKDSLSNYKLTVQAWCDSQVVLAWIQGSSCKWEKYVANRVEKIKNIIPAYQWHYIKSQMNVADDASRGLTPSKLINHKLWWSGPEFLKTIKLTENQETVGTYTTNLEIKKQEKESKGDCTNKYILIELLYKYSSLSRAIRVLAWARRFITQLRSRVKPNTNYLSTRELINANEEIIKCVQQIELKHEYLLLGNGAPLTGKSLLFKLNAYMDNKGIIRVGGRLKNSILPLEAKNPIILPKCGRYTELLIQMSHAATLHGGARLTLTYIRQRYWIIGGNRVVKAQLRKCVLCHRYKGTQTHPLMGNLPASRITPSRPFTHTGLDYTGYIFVKHNKGRGVKTSKGYVAVFVCMATKAVHLELVSDMSTEAFLAAFQRLCSRRGTPKHVYSDCGTNFVGAAKILKENYQDFKQMLNDSLFIELTKLEVEWHFNAPAWPSAGGIWEAAVKSLKHHLKRVLGEQKLTYEELSTLITRVEACLNSRPLCPITEDPEEFYSCLTPGHFLTGSAILSPPHADCSDIKTINIRNRWQLTEHMAQRFWKLWSTDYLQQLQVRSKWNKPTKNIKEGDVVLVKEDNLPPGKWALGRVQAVHPGADGYVRVTTIKTQRGELKRPVVKLSPLPIDEVLEKPEPDKIKHTSARKGRQSLLTILTTLLTLFTFITGIYGQTVSSNIQVFEVEPERPIYYDKIGNLQMVHDDWTLVMYYNLTKYWEGTRRLKSYLSELTKLCKKTDPRYCQTSLNQLYHEEEELTYYNNLLLTPHTHLTQTRRKRGLINGVGYVANSLFGILDERFAEKYETDIEAVQDNENHLLQLIKNQTSIMELQNKILKKNEEHLEKQFNMISNFMNQTNKNFVQVKEEIEISLASSYFSSASLSAYMLINDLKKIQEMLFNTLTDLYKGHMDVHLITPAYLLQQLTAINEKLPKTASIPVKQMSIRDIYKTLQVKARVTEAFFIFEIQIPLLSEDEYTLYRAIPLPIKRSEEIIVTVKTKASYIALNFKKNTFISITEQQLGMCILQQKERFTCHNNLPVFNLHNTKTPCEAKLLGQTLTLPCDVTLTTCNEQWIELHVPNMWLVINCAPRTLRKICNNEISTVTLSRTAIIRLKEGCIIQATELTIYANNHYKSKEKIEYDLVIPTLNGTINDIVNLTYFKSPNKQALGDSDINTLEELTNYQQEQESKSLSKLSSHDIHQYAVSYSLVGIVVLVLFCWVVRKRCRCLLVRAARTPASETRPREVIEMTEVRSMPQEPQRSRTAQLSSHIAKPTHATKNLTSISVPAGNHNALRGMPQLKPVPKPMPPPPPPPLPSGDEIQRRAFIHGANNLAFSFDE